MSADTGGGRRRRGRDLDGILLLDKPRGLSSNAALQRAKRIFTASKAGHTGNLDVQASGLLPVCFGEATKVCQFLLEADKRYVAQFTLGQRTSTGDCEGQVISTRATAGIGAADVARVVAAFRGPITQIPPMHSAIKHHGQPLYKLAHQGIEIARAERSVTIHAFDVVAFETPCLEVDVACSKGTYIRTLAEDVGELLGCGAYVSALRRVQAGPYALGGAYSLEQLEEFAERGQDVLDAVLLPLDTALATMPLVTLTDEAVYYLVRGQAVLVPRAPTAGLLRLYDARARFVGVGEIQDDGRVAPRRLFRVRVADSLAQSERRRA